ncbi:hypothetical protein SteCoe_233 [Stentor coeruleus]|uniref:Uncharacterized protein n=1 Tax=Stentor coeruleus TaxID=5963 RepID=A0A1R2D4V9_9CILI|nr:hypothetical protein SteCoe_233 [Stentor coeruleus]
MILRTRSTPRPISQKAPSTQTELPPLSIQNTKFDDPMLRTKLCLNNFLSTNYSNESDMAYVPRKEIKALSELCNQLIQGQAELKKRLEKQELIIETLKINHTKPKIRLLSQDQEISKRTSSNHRRLPAFTPRASEESGSFTFRPTESTLPKSKFPRDVFSRKSRARPL